MAAVSALVSPSYGGVSVSPKFAEWEKQAGILPGLDGDGTDQ